MLFGSTGPERGHHPADKPGNPDERQQLGGPGGGPPTPREGEYLTEIMRHAAGILLGNQIKRHTGDFEGGAVQYTGVVPALNS